MDKPYPKHNHSPQNASRQPKFHSSFKMPKQNILPHDPQVAIFDAMDTQIKALDDVLYTRLSQGISEIVETTTQDLEDFSEDEKKSEGYQEILKIHQDLKDLINHP